MENKKIRAFAKSLGLDVSKLARIMRVHPATLYNIEKGRYNDDSQVKINHMTRLIEISEKQFEKECNAAIEMTKNAKLEHQKRVKLLEEMW